jgi:allantoicase
MDTVRYGETVEQVKQRLGKPSQEFASTQIRRVRRGGATGTTTHVIEPAVEARFVRLNIIPDGGVSRLRLVGRVAR